MTILLHDLGLALVAYFILAILQCLALPALLHVAKKLPELKDGGWIFGRLATLTVLAFLLWTLAHLGLPVNQPLAIYALLLLLALGSWQWLRHLGQQAIRDFWQQRRRIVVIEEIIFLLAFLFLLCIRSFQPEILGLEKFMDAGFIQAYLKSPTLPAGDMWLAGESINYYSFGHFSQAVLVQLWHIDLAYAYNLLLATIFALFCSQIFSLVFNLRSSLRPAKEKQEFGRAVFSGLLAILLVVVGGNGHSLWYWLQNGSLVNYWYPDATRFIDKTIHEFPAYSFVVADLHPHVLALPLLPLLLLVLFLWCQTFVSQLQRERFLTWRGFFRSPLFYFSSALGFLYGLLLMTNTWDVLNYGLLLIILGLYVLQRNWRSLLNLFLAAATVALTMLLTALFWYLNFTAISGGLRLATEQSPLWQLLALWGPHLLLATLGVIFLFRLYVKKKVKNLAPVVFLTLMLLTAWLLFILPEFFYFQDIYSTYPRANTMFKLVFQAFSLLGIILSICLTLLPGPGEVSFLHNLLTSGSRPSNKKISKLGRSSLWLGQGLILYWPLLLFFFFVLAYPYQAYKSYYGGLRNYQGLDGLAWFERKYPEDWRILNYLKSQEPEQVVILEAPGESYSEHNKISAFSGMQTVVGWQVHEWLWRGSWDVPSQRVSQVAQIYNDPLSSNSLAQLLRYGVKYIIIGSAELESYPNLAVAGLLSLGQPIYQSNGHYLIKLY